MVWDKPVRPLDSSYLTDLTTPPARHLGKWDLRFFEMAELVATWSKDPEVRVGVVVVSPDRRRFSVGYNGLPAGVEDTAERLSGAQRVSLTVHAELNAILNSVDDLAGWTMYATRQPCLECAKAIIQSRVARVVSPVLPHGSSWTKSCYTGALLMREAKVAVDYVEKDAPC